MSRSERRAGATAQRNDFQTVVVLNTGVPIPVIELPVCFFRHLEEVLKEIGFFNSKHPNKLMQKLRRLYARARLEQEEVNMLRGILSATTGYHSRPKRENENTIKTELNDVPND